MQDARPSLPRYGAAEAIAQALTELMLEKELASGDPFLSDHQVMNYTGKSRTAVRRALKLLQDGEWIERRNGVGTFVGPQLDRYKQETLGNAVRTLQKSEADQRLLRVAIVGAGLEIPSRQAEPPQSLESSWYFNGVIQGLSSLALEENFIIELLGASSVDPLQIFRRFEQNRPDVLIGIGPPLRYFSVVGEAARRGIPTVLAVCRIPEMNITSVYEDNFDASRQAVRHLLERGHRRIGFLQTLSPCGWWSIDRYEGYRRAILEAKIPFNEDLSLWLSPETSDPENALRRFLHRRPENRPDALICGSHHSAFWLTQLLRNGELKLPDDMSLVVFDQRPNLADTLGGVTPTTIALPLHEIGRTIARLIRKLANKDPNIPLETILPCTLIPGESVR